MPNYFYTAKSFQGEDKSGNLVAKDKHELAKILRGQDLILITANVEEDQKKKIGISLPFFNGVSVSDKLMFTRNLQLMVGAGVSLPRGIKILSGQAKSKRFKNALLEICEEINKGKNFSESLAKYPGIFSELFSNMIRVGEESGTLEETLKNLTYQMEREYELKSKIKGAMMYPAVVICAMVGIGIMMLIMVVPKLSQTFTELEVELPVTTRIVMGTGNFLAKNWFLLPFAVIILVLLFRIFLRTKSGKRVFDALTLRVPVISAIIRKTNSANTARDLSSLFAAGVPIVQALEIVSGALSNFYFKQAIKSAAEEVRKGGKLSDALKPYQNIYPPIVSQLVEIGEETGQTTEILSKLANFYEEEVTNATKNLSSLIEPILMLLIGGVIGFFAISMIQPMYSMLGAIK